MPRVTEQIYIDAPRLRVWETLADIGAVSDWNPTVTHSATTSGDAEGVGAARSCDISGVGPVQETVVEWDERRAMFYEIDGASMMKRFQAGFTLDDEGAGTRVVMRADFDMTLGPLGALMAATMGKRRMRATLQKVLGGLKAHVEAREAPPAAEPASDRGERP